MDLFWIVFMIFGLIGLGVGIKLVLVCVNSTKWPTTRGRIITSAITREANPHHDTTAFHPEITYTYSVDGREYRGRRISAGDYDSSNGTGARKLVDKYPPGTEAEVFYDPNEPGNALLEPGFRFLPVLILVVGAFFFIAATLGLLGLIGGTGGYSF